MAKITSGFLTCASGRIGGHTLYVSGGQQIIYERSGRKRSYTSTRHYELSDAMRLAQRWRTELMNEGVDVSLQLILSWVYAIRNVAYNGGLVSLASSLVGAWSPDVVKIMNNGVYTSAGYHLPTGAGIAQQGFGMPWAGYGGDFTTTHVWDAVENIYPTGCIFLAVQGEEFRELQLIIGRRIEYSGALNTIYRTNRNVPLYGGNLFAGRVYITVPPSGAPKLTGRVYAIRGWSNPDVVLNGERVFAWAIITQDGVPIELAAAHAT